MSRITLVVLLAVAVVAVALVGSFLVTGSSPFDQRDDATREDGGPEGTFPEAGRGPEGPGGERVRSPVLFGRASARVGKGDVIGRVADFATMQPVAGAAVRLEGRGYAAEVVSSSSESGTDGRIHLPAVPAGEGYTLEVVVDDVVVRRLAGLTVSADDVTELGTIWLGDAGTLTGRVVSVEGGGIAGATVRVLPGGSSMEQMFQDIVGFISKLDRDPAPIAEGKTDANGRFAIEGIPPGPITIVARAPGFYQEIRQATMAKDGAIGEEPLFRMVPATYITGRVISTSGGGIEGARIAFMDPRNEEAGFHGRRFVDTDASGAFEVASPPRAVRLLAIVAADGYPTLFTEIEKQREGLELVLAGGATLTLRFVHDETGEPIPDASIVAMLSESPKMDDEGCLLTGVTDARGEIELQAKPGFVVLLFFGHPVLGPGMYGPERGAYLSGMALKGPDQLEVTAGENRAELRKVPGVVVTGRVTNAAGEPIAGATVHAGGGFLPMGHSGKAVTDEDGRYRLTVVAMPQMTVGVEAPGYVQDPTTMMFELDPPHPAEHDIVLIRAARVEGRVVGPQGQPARGVQVQLQVEPEKRDRDVVRFSGVTGGLGMTDDAGRYVFDTVVPDRTYFVVGKGEGYIASRSDPFEVRLNVEVVKAPRLVMQMGLEVDVEVLDPSGEAVNGASVQVYVEPMEGAEWAGVSRWQEFQTLATDARGRATAKDVPPGKVTFTAAVKGFAASKASIVVSRASPPTRPVVVRLRTAAVVAGVVRDQHEAAVKGARLSVAGDGEARRGRSETDEDWIPTALAVTDAEGRFRLEGVPEGVVVTLSVYAEGYSSQMFPLEGPTDRLELQIQKIDPAVQQRLEAIQAEIMGVYQRMQSAQDAAEQEALQKQIEALTLEASRLRQGGSAMAESAVVEDDE